MIKAEKKLIAKKISEILCKKSNHIEEMVEIRGWIKNIRRTKKQYFVDVNDGTCFKNLQLVIPSEYTNTNNINITTGTTICAKGRIITNQFGNLELSVSDIEIIGVCPP